MTVVSLCTSVLRRLTKVCAASLAIIVAPIVAQAGQYIQISQTGGQMTNSPGPPYATPYSVTGYGYGGAFGGGNWSKCMGTITTRFEWQPSYAGDLPPSQVLVSESCEASYQTDAYPSGGSGSCDNGLGHSAVTTSGGIPGGGGTSIGQRTLGKSTGTRYKVQAGQQTVEVTCSPSAQAATPSGGTVSRVYYSASVTVMSINFTGGIEVDHQRKYLIGQKVVASVGGAPVSSTSNYSWSIDGGEPFRDYYASRQLGFKSDLDSTHLSSSIPFWYFAKPDLTKVNCTLTLNFPSGTLPASGLSVTLEKNVQAEKPLTIPVRVTIGSALVTFDSGWDLRLWGATLPPDYYNPFGTYWKAKITTPAEFGGSGNWSFMQEVTCDRNYTTDEGDHYSMVKNGIQGIDSEFPYPDPPLYVAGSQFEIEGDAPKSSLDPFMHHASMADEFETYTIYLPPGTGSVWVPIERWDWSWGGVADEDAVGNWSLTSGEASVNFFANFPTHPEWDINPGDYIYQYVLNN